VYDPSKAFSVTATIHSGVSTLWEEIANTGGDDGQEGIFVTDLLDSAVVPNTVGGIGSGTTVADLRNKTFSELFQKLLFPAIAPSFVAPTIQLSSNLTGPILIGTQNLSLSATVNRGSILESWNGNSTQNLRAGTVQWYTYANDNVSLPSADQISDNTYSKSGFAITQGAHILGLSVRFNQGPQPKDNFGANILSPLPITTLSASVVYEGVYPIFATTANTSTLTQQSLYSMLSGNGIEIVLSAEVDSNRQAFAVPQTWLTARPLVAVYYFNNVSNSFSNVNKISEFSTSNITQTISGSSVSYVKYNYNALMRGETKIKLVF
jgi:hypothetical protein